MKSSGMMAVTVGDMIKGNGMVREQKFADDLCWQLQSLGASYGGGLEGLDSAYGVMRRSVGETGDSVLDEMVGTGHLMALDFEGAFRHIGCGTDRYDDALDVLLLIGNDVKLVKKHAPDEVYEGFLRENALSNIGMGIDEKGYFLDGDSLLFIMDELQKRGIDPNDHMAETARRMEEGGKRNTPKMMLLAYHSGDMDLYDHFREDYVRKLMSRRDRLDTRIHEYCAASGDRSYIAKLQQGDCNPFFAIASSVYLLENCTSKEVVKEHLHLYTDFSRYDGYTSEMDILSKVSHPDIIGYKGSVTLDGHSFMRLEFFEGEELTRYAREGMDVCEAARLVRRHADVLSYLHAQGIMYMDIKDKNTMYDGDGMRILDFGMAQRMDGPVDDDTEARSLLSTPQYIPPEWATGFRVNNRSEVFQLGVLFHQLVTGRHPFVEQEIEPSGDDRIKGLMSYTLGNVYRSYVTPAELSTEPEMESLLERMIAKEPWRRPRAEEVSQAIMTYERGCGP
mgnify:CR=1 FL=1